MVIYIVVLKWCAVTQTSSSRLIYNFWFALQLMGLLPSSHLYSKIVAVYKTIINGEAFLYERFLSSKLKPTAQKTQWKCSFFELAWRGSWVILMNYLLSVLMLSNYIKFKRMALIGDATYVKFRLCGDEEILLGLLDAWRRRQNVRRNVGNYSTDDTGSHSRRPPSSIPSKFALLFYAHTTQTLCHIIIPITEVCTFLLLFFFNIRPVSRKKKSRQISPSAKLNVMCGW